MSGLWLPAVAAIVVTYLCCLRPMRRGHCAMTSSEKQQRAVGTLDQALADARAELATLKANTDHRAPEDHHATPAAYASNVASRRIKP